MFKFSYYKSGVLSCLISDTLAENGFEKPLIEFIKTHDQRFTNYPRRRQKGRFYQDSASEVTWSTHY